MRLNALAKTTGHTKTSLAREAVQEFIGNLEDFYLAETCDRQNRKSIALDEVEQQLGLGN